MEQLSEAERIVRLMLFIRRNGPVSFFDIREALPYEYGIGAGNKDSMRHRFERDKATLQENGIFLEIDADNRYSLDAARSKAAPLRLTKPQVSLIRLLCSALLDDPAYPYKEELRMVLVKLGDELEIPDMLPQVIDTGAETGAPDRKLSGLSKIKRAVSNRKLLTFDYSDSKGRVSSRTIQPIGCLLQHGRFYVAAYDPVKDAFRTFRLDRMKGLKTANNSKTPDFEEIAFDISQFYGLPFEFGDEEYDVVMRIEESTGHDLCSLTLGRGALEDDGDGMKWTVSCRNTAELARWCIENANDVRILEPLEARKAVRDVLQTFIATRGGKEASHE